MTARIASRNTTGWKWPSWPNMAICLEPMSQRELGYARPDANAPIASDEWRWGIESLSEH